MIHLSRTRYPTTHAPSAATRASRSRTPATSPGIILIGLGLAALGLTLTAAGGGFEGWSVIGGVVTGVCFVVGVALIVLEHRRVK